MFSLSYPAILRREKNGGYYMSFPDIRGADTGDQDREKTLAGAADCVAVALETYMEQKRDIPMPSKPKKGESLIAVPLDLAMKIAVYQAMRDAHVTHAELARRTKVPETHVRRILKWAEGEGHIVRRANASGGRVPARWLEPAHARKLPAQSRETSATLCSWEQAGG